MPAVWVRYARTILISLVTIAMFSWHGVARAAQLTLRWTDNAMNEDGFQIERKIGSAGTFTLIATTKADVTLYTNIDLTFGSTYCYRVRTHNAAGYSDYSNEVCKLAAQQGIITLTDYDGDMRTDLSVFRPSNRSWFIDTNQDGVTDLQILYGVQDDIPLPADYDGMNSLISRSSALLTVTGTSTLISMAPQLLLFLMGRLAISLFLPTIMVMALLISRSTGPPVAGGHRYQPQRRHRSRCYLRYSWRYPTPTKWSDFSRTGDSAVRHKTFTSGDLSFPFCCRLGEQ
jgi:hypothetical protein